MNVRLAVQTMSESVKQALLWAHHDMNLPEYEEADATAEFCGMLNEIFDLLNVRSRFCKKPSQILIRKETIPAIEKLTDQFIKYLQRLKVTKLQTGTDGKDTVVYEEVVKSSRKTGFVGLIICLKNIIPIFQQISGGIPGHVQPC